MYIEIVPNRNSRPAILLREGWREGKRVRKRTLANLTDWPSTKLEALRRVLRNEPLVRPDEAFRIERSRPHGHIEAVLECTHRLGLERLLSAKRCRERDLVLAMVIERLVHPASKLATTRLWHTTTLAEERPIALEVYPGNSGDPSTVPAQVEKLRHRFGLEQVVLVGDRGMLTHTQIAHLERHPGLGWISVRIPANSAT